MQLTETGSVKVTFITTYKHGHSARLANLKCVLDNVQRIMPGIETIVVEQGAKRTLEAGLAPGAIVQFVHNPGAFNKSWGMNVAASSATGDVLIVCDADMLLHSQALQRALQACETELDAVRPYSRLIDMTQEQTRQFFEDGVLPESPVDTAGYDRQHAGETICFAGGVFVIRRDYYDRLGGMDERFSGWGGEDDAMSIKIQGLSPRVAVARDAVAWHLWHPRDGRYDHAEYASNLALLQQYRQLDKDALGALCGEQRHSFGRLDRYLHQQQTKPLQ